VELDEGSSVAHLSLSGAFIWSNQHEPSIAETRIAMQLNPSNVYACLALGNRLDITGNPGEGIPLMEKSLRLNPRDPHNPIYFVALGRAHINQRKYDLALAQLREAIRRRPDLPHAYHVMAICLGHLGRIEEARAAAETCERIRPGFLAKRVHWNIYLDPEANRHLTDGLRKAGLA
jgi:adenylate cyclase